MTDYLSLVKNIQTLIFSYQDVSTIYSKLEAQGHLEKLVALLVDVYSEEHEFTLNELRKYGRDSNQREEDFLEEQYELNSTIFRRNFSLIVQNIADEIGRSFLGKFKKEYPINGKKHPLAIRVEHEFLDDHPNPNKFGKPQYKSDMPEIQEETESTGKISPLKSSAAKTQRENDFIASSARSFELNIEELSQKSRIPHDPSTPWSNYDHSTQRSAENFGRYEQQQPTVNGISPISISSTVKKKESSKVALTRMVGDQQLYYNQPPLTEPKQTKDSQRSIEVIVGDAGGGYTRSYSQEKVERMERVSMNSNPVSTSSRGQSPSNKIGKSPANSVMSSRYSVPQEPPLDSEFVYTKGATFSKAERIGFFNQINVPGPGHYDPDDALKAVKRRSPVSSFPRSPKFSVFDKTTQESPGAIYSPTHHFLSK